jgi:hypothetical protein
MQCVSTLKIIVNPFNLLNQGSRLSTPHPALRADLSRKGEVILSKHDLADLLGGSTKRFDFYTGFFTRSD